MGIRETAGTVPSFRPTDGKMLPGRLDPTASRAAKDVTPSPALSASCRKRGPKRPGQAARRTNFLPVQLQPCRKLRERNSGHLQEQTGINASALPEQGDNARVQDGSAAERAQGEHAPERAQDGNIRVRNAGRDAPISRTRIICLMGFSLSSRHLLRNGRMSSQCAAPQSCATPQSTTSGTSRCTPLFSRLLMSAARRSPASCPYSSGTSSRSSSCT